ncbi:hypothetical protein Areg01_89250 [Actinoplanes regularis]|nr:hypothetical protein Areg01_89250 [Actinoplanes regularis]
MRTRRVATSITTSMHKRLNPIVSMWKKSIAGRPWAWTRRNVRQLVSAVRVLNPAVRRRSVGTWSRANGWLISSVTLLTAGSETIGAAIDDPVSRLLADVHDRRLYRRCRGVTGGAVVAPGVRP